MIYSTYDGSSVLKQIKRGGKFKISYKFNYSLILITKLKHHQQKPLQCSKLKNQHSVTTKTHFQLQQTHLTTNTTNWYISLQTFIFNTQYFYIYTNKMKVLLPLTLLLLIVFCASQSECLNKIQGEQCSYTSYIDGVCCSCNGTLKCLSGDQCCGQCLGIADYEHCCDKKSKYNYACPNGFLCVSYKNCQQLNLNMFIGISFGIGMILVFGLIIGLSYYFYKKKSIKHEQPTFETQQKLQ